MKVWRTAAVDEAAAARLAGDLSVPLPFARLLASRGVAERDAADAFLNPRLKSLSDPGDLPGMPAAAEAVWAAIAAERRIAVYGDYDVDGVSATALLVRAFRALGAVVEPFLPLRLEDGYGLTPDTVERCIELHRPSLIVTVDCGTNSADAVGRAREKGVDVVITDHHQSSGEPAPAVAVVNPRLAPPGRAWSDLAGVGVAFKLAHAVLKLARDAGRPGADAVDLRDFLDLVALGTVADCVSLTGENRVLVRHGLDVIRRAPSIGIRALMQVVSLKEDPDAWHIGFLLAPRLNAAGRLGTAEDALNLLLASDAERAAALARDLDRANRERQELEQAIVASAMERIDANYDPARDFALVVADPGWHPGVIGIVASRLVARYNRPAVVIALDGEGGGRGSCRGIESVDLAAALRDCSALLGRCGGHAMAAGLDIEANRVDEFRTRFNSVIAARVNGRVPPPVLPVDSWMTLDEADEGLLDCIERARPCGQGNPAPVWAVRDVEVETWQIMKEKHVRVRVRQGAAVCSAVGFNFAARGRPEGRIDIAFELRRNTWNGRSSLQLQLRDFRPCTPA
jgi:single-stranded-DNA-specific exonuclease